MNYIHNRVDYYNNYRTMALSCVGALVGGVFLCHAVIRHVRLVVTNLSRVLLADAVRGAGYHCNKTYRELLGTIYLYVLFGNERDRFRGKIQPKSREVAPEFTNERRIIETYDFDVAMGR